MIRDIAILGVGVAIGYYLLKPKKAGTNPVRVVKMGDKAKGIEGMQKAFEKIGGLKFDSYGQYDSDTLAAAQYHMEGTNSLVDQDSGAIKASFVNDISTIYNNSLKS